MPTHRLNRSVPFWVLVGGSAVATIAGAYVLITKLASMNAAFTDGSATTADVYVGQIWAVSGAILGGIGLIGFALALTVAALGSFASAPAAEVVEAPAWEEDVTVVDPATVTAPVDVEPAVTDATADAARVDAAQSGDAEAPAGTEAPRA